MGRRITRAAAKRYVLALLEAYQELEEQKDDEEITLQQYFKAYQQLEEQFTDYLIELLK